jgi:flagellar biosynthesis anti-sigma factor FlgM
MRIADPNSPGHALPAETAASPSAARPPQDDATGAATLESDRAELSRVADRVTELLQADSGDHAERIRQLKEAVANGTYQVDSAAVSRAMVDEAISAGGGTDTGNQ